MKKKKKKKRKLAEEVNKAVVAAVEGTKKF